ncbi:MAG: hypothetical protein QM817_38860 [Archangium sp.]
MFLALSVTFLLCGVQGDAPREERFAGALLPSEVTELAQLERARATIFTPPIVLLSVGAVTLLGSFIALVISGAVPTAALSAWFFVVPIIGLAALAAGLIILPIIAIDAHRISERIGRLRARLPPGAELSRAPPLIELARF